MTTMLDTIFANTAQIIETPVLLAVAVAAMAIRVGEPSRKVKARASGTGPVSRHTLTDIGVEPGSITWLR